MKKLLLATAIATLSVSAAQAAPTVYGKAFLTADYVVGGDNDKTVTTDTYVAGERTAHDVKKSSTDGDSTTSLNSTGSHIGFRGGEPLTANTDLVYQLEYGIEVDADNNAASEGRNQNQFYARDTYLGLSNKHYGTFVAGRLTTIDDNINYANRAAGGVLGGDDVLASFTAPRANNAFAYFSPDYNGAQFMAMYGLDSDQDLGGLADHDQYGVGVKYEPKGQAYRAGATYITAGDALTAIRLSGDYKLNPAITVGALYQNTDWNTDDNENAFTLSGAYKTATPWTTYAQADIVQNVQGSNDADAQRFILGGKYAFNANTTGHVYGAYLNGEATTTTNNALVNGTGTVIKTKSEKDGFGVGTGIEYKF